jgi:outer membrane protein OmpA-like peptidoglycan-associated protein
MVPVRCASRTPRDSGRRHACGKVALVLLAAGLALVGCSEFDPRSGLMTEVNKPIPGADQPFPNLASVPDKAPEVTPLKERKSLERKLERDNRSQTYKPDDAAMPALPKPPPALPEGFTTADKPVKLAQAAPASGPSAPAAAGPTQAAAPAAKAAPAPRPATGTQPAATPRPSAPAAQAPPPAAPSATLSGGGPSFGALGQPSRVGIVLFAPGSSAIDPGQVHELKPIVRMLRQRGGLLQVVGYAAADPHAKNLARDKLANFNLSLDRANAVARVLMRLGVKPSELIISAEGDSAPVAAVAGVSGRAANERADIYLE